MQRHRAALLATTFVAALAGCSGSAGTGGPSSTTTAGAGAVRVLASATTGSTAAATVGRFALGQGADLTQVTLAVTEVLRKDGAGGAQLGAQVVGCVAATAPAPAAFTIGSWSVVGSDGRIAKASGIEWGVAASPDTPIGDALIDPGSCGGGLVVFAPSGELTPAKLAYRNASGTALTWELPTP